eukprot:14351051-Alexandrium_andersonii.AAC.1
MEVSEPRAPGPHCLAPEACAAPPRRAPAPRLGCPTVSYGVLRCPGATRRGKGVGRVHRSEGSALRRGKGCRPRFKTCWSAARNLLLSEGSSLRCGQQRRPRFRPR